MLRVRPGAQAEQLHGVFLEDEREKLDIKPEGRPRLKEEDACEQGG